MNTQDLAKLRSIVPEMRRVRHIHFVGIGGAGMGGIAEVLANEGYQISGSDLAPNPVTQQLTQLGATIYFNHRPENVRDASVVVVSSAISADNPEIVARPRSAYSGYSPRRDAGGADAFSPRHCHCRHARKDHNHGDGLEHLR